MRESRSGFLSKMIKFIVIVFGKSMLQKNVLKC